MNDSNRGRRMMSSLRSLWLLLAVACGLSLLSARSASANPSALRFEPNLGQFDAQVRYVARGRSYALFLTPDGATLALHRSKQAGAEAQQASGDDQQSVVTMKLKGAASVEPRALVRLPGQSNYFGGKEPARWRSGVAGYSRVRYEAVLPGVDVEYYGTEGSELEYDFKLAAGVAPSSLIVELDGISHIELRPDGSARLRLMDGAEIVKKRPVAYQVRGGRRMPVSVKYELRAGGLGFAVAEHDSDLPLVIDPVLTYSSYFGGSSFDEALGIAADSGGNTYFVGYTASTLFPTFSPQQPTHGGGSYDAFVVKLDPTGTSIVYSTYLGGNGADMAYAVACDAFGNAYVVGLTTSSNFPVVSALQPTLGGAQDAFVTKLNATGSAIAYSTYLGGSLDDYAKGIAVSGAGAAYLVGTTFSANFPRATPLQATLNGAYDAFAAQIAPGGASLVYSTYLGGSGTEYGNAIALDTSGSAYVVGSTTSSNFPTSNARQPAHAGGGTDAFLSKLNLTGSGFVFSTYLGGSAADEALGVSWTLNTAIVVGSTSSSNFPLAFAAQAASGGNNHSDAFITRFDPSGTALLYSTYLGGSGNDSATGAASDSFGNAYLIGQTDSSDLPLENPLDGQSASHGAGDAFVAALTPSGSRFVYTSYLGGAGQDRGAGVAVAAGTTYIVGNTRSTDFPKVLPIINGLVGAQDAFVARLPVISSASAPAFGWASLALAAVSLLGIALLLLTPRRSAHYRNEH